MGCGRRRAEDIKATGALYTQMMALLPSSRGNYYPPLKSADLDAGMVGMAASWDWQLRRIL